MKPVVPGLNLAAVDELSREQLIARVLGMRQGVAVALSLGYLRELSRDRLRVLLLMANLVRVARASTAVARLPIGFDQPPW
jgi:hypothetical protein